MMGRVEICVYFGFVSANVKDLGEMKENNTTSTSLVLYMPMLLQAQSMHIRRACKA